MQERKSWIDHPAFKTVNKTIKDKLRELAFDFHIAVQQGDEVLATDLVQEAKGLKVKKFPYEIIPGGKAK